MPTTYAIPNGRTVMDATTYTGNGSTQSINNSDLGTSGFKPDLVWVKDRSAAQWNNLTDSVRGVGKEIFTNASNAEETNGGISSLNSNGFSLINWDGANKSGDSYVAWQWQAGQGTTSNNTSGTITSTVSANVTAGFSIVTYTGTGSAATVGHGLGVAPAFIAIKIRNNTYSWRNYHASLGNAGYVYFNSTDAYTASSTTFNSTSPTSSVFSVGTEVNTNASGGTFVAYCWAEVAGFSKFGSYTGNGSSDGPFIYTGFRPKYIMIKCSSTGSLSWVIFDTSRNPYNSGTEAGLWPNETSSELNYTTVDLLSNGVKIRETSPTVNGNGNTYIYAAFAETPFKYANAR